MLSAFAWSISEYCEAALDDPLVPHPRQGGEGALECDRELLVPRGRQQFVVGGYVVHECDVESADAHALQAVLDRTTHAVRRIVEHNVVGRRRERKIQLGVVVRRRLEQLAHLRGQDVVIAILIVEEVSITSFRKPKAVPRRYVVIAHAGIPGGLERLVGILITDQFELVAQGHTAKTELDGQHVAPAATSGRVGGRRQRPARKDAAGRQRRAGRGDAKEIPSG